jgi:hypothetical protein
LEDSSIYFCLGECDRDGHWDYDAATIDIVRQSLKQLLEIPEDLPVEDFPPPAGMVMVKKYRGVPVWPRPIPVSERLPEPDAECLFFDEYSGWWMNSWDDIPKSTRPKITHWLPLPPKP